MTDTPPPIREDDTYYYVPEEYLEHMPPELQAGVQEVVERAKAALKMADRELKSLRALANAFSTTASLRYIYDRLRMAKFDETTNAWLEQEMLTTSFVVTYARLFVKAKGTSVLSSTHIPDHLLPIHEHLMTVRHQRYAHNGGHDSLGSELNIDFQNDVFKLNLTLNNGFYVGGRDEWKELITFLDAHMYERLQKLLGQLRDKTGFEWQFPTGPTPEWLHDSK